MSTKLRFPRHTALTAARDALAALKPACEEGRIIVAGSLRRRKQWVGDVEIVYVSRIENRPVPGDMFRRKDYHLADLAIAELEQAGVLARRIGSAGGTAYGPQNKLMVHVATGVPVDFFATIETSWHNYLVCRTGPAESNTRIATLAREKGWNWNPYGSGFTKTDGSEAFAATCEEDVFRFVGLPFHEPNAR